MFAHSLTVNCTNANYRDVPHNIFLDTRKLNFYGNLLHRLKNENLSRLVEVRYLKLRNYGVTYGHDKSITPFRNLRELWTSKKSLLSYLGRPSWSCHGQESRQFPQS